MTHLAAGAPAAANRRSRGLPLRRALREPLLQFLLLGAAIFAIAHAIERHRSNAERQIVIDDGTVGRLAQLYRMQMGATPSPARLEALIDGHVRDEVLYREALRMGLDRDDEIVRRRLVQKMDFLNRDSAAVPESGDAALRAYYGAHTAEFAEAPRLSFTHRYFSPDLDGEQGARRRADAALRELRLQRPAQSDRFALQDHYDGLTPPELEQIFGRSPIVDGLLRAPPGEWSGPLQSGYGWHLVQVTQRRDAYVPPFEQVLERVRAAWIEQERRKLDDAGFAALRSRYEVLRSDRAAPP
ncbi:MAG: peptidylprolyl isomerase [Solimonas sp.]